MGMGVREASECVRFTFGWSTESEAGVNAAGLVALVAGELR
jgi:hypothetical protein